MISVPSIPADSMYKFFGLLGVFVFLSCLVAPAVVKRDREAFEHQVATEGTDQFSKYVALNLEMLKADPAYRDAPKLLETTHHSFATRLAAQELDTQRAHIERRHRSAERNLQQLRVGRAVGLALMLGWLPLWFFRQQVHQDRAAKGADPKGTARHTKPILHRLWPLSRRRMAR